MHAMRCGTRRVLGLTVVAAVMLSVLPPAACSPSSVDGSTNEGGQGEGMVGLRLATAAVGVGEKGGNKRFGRHLEFSMKQHLKISQGKSETELIQPISLPFKQRPDEWTKKGISLTATGEPKSGTTWFARVLTEMCSQLCGNPENTWCEMGGLTVHRSPPAPWYEFEMLHAETKELFLHFRGHPKHEIPGLGMRGDCSSGGRAHEDDFGYGHPCSESSDFTREALTACLPDRSPSCARYLPPLDQAVRRMAVIFRDPRNVIISEHRMRINVYHHNVGELEPYIHYRFEKLLAWIHQRWVWHTTALRTISLVMFYEDLQAHPHHLIELAAFVGLNCTAEQADDVWQRHAFVDRRGDYTTYGLSMETLELMNNTMATILPEAMLDLYGLTPIHASSA